MSKKSSTFARFFGMTGMKRYIQVLVLALLCAVPLWAQEQFDAHLVGHVLDEKTGEHLPYVNVQIKGTNIGTVTDESGHYFLKDLPLGRQIVVFSYVGYETLEQRLFPKQDVLNINVELPTDAEALAEVEVRGIRRQLDQMDRIDALTTRVMPNVSSKRRKI